MTLKKYLWEKAKKGSFTIEAACVMSLILVAVMGILYLCFFVHNRAWLTAAACESALTGSMEGISSQAICALTHVQDFAMDDRMPQACSGCCGK